MDEVIDKKRESQKKDQLQEEKRAGRLTAPELMEHMLLNPSLKIDEVMAYDLTLSASEVLLLLKNGVSSAVANQYPPQYSAKERVNLYKQGIITPDQVLAYEKKAKK